MFFSLCFCIVCCSSSHYCFSVRFSVHFFVRAHKFMLPIQLLLFLCGCDEIADEKPYNCKLHTHTHSSASAMAMAILMHEYGMNDIDIWIYCDAVMMVDCAHLLDYLRFNLTPTASTQSQTFSIACWIGHSWFSVFRFEKKEEKKYFGIVLFVVLIILIWRKGAQATYLTRDWNQEISFSFTSGKNFQFEIRYIFIYK